MALDLKAKVSLDGSGFEAGLHKLEHGVQHVVGELKNLALTAFGIYGVEAAIEKTYQRAKELVTESKRIGVGVEQLQLLKQAAKDSNSDLETVVKVLEKIDEARLKIIGKQDGFEKNLAAFGKLGVTKGDIGKLSATEIFMGPLRQSANKMNQEIFEPFLKAAINLKGVGVVVPILQTDFENLEHSMKSIGALMDTDTAVRIKYLGDEFELLSQILTAQFGPAIIGLVEQMLKAGDTTSQIISHLGSMQASGAKYGGAIPFAGEYEKAKDIINGDPGRLANLEKKDPEWIAHLREVIADMENAQRVGGEAAIEAHTEWVDMIEKMRKKLDEEAKKLDHPPKPDFSGEKGVLPVKTPHVKALAAGDALISVGNFLGSNRNPLSLVAEKQLHVLKAIEHNTRSQGTRGATHPRMPHL